MKSISFREGFQSFIQICALVLLIVSMNQCKKITKIFLFSAHNYEKKQQQKTLPQKFFVIFIIITYETSFITKILAVLGVLHQ